jgi:hypothetical protein
LVTPCHFDHARFGEQQLRSPQSKPFGAATLNSIKWFGLSHNNLNTPLCVAARRFQYPATEK